MISNRIVIYGSGSGVPQSIADIGANHVLAVVDREVNAGKVIRGGVTVQSDVLLKSIEEPFDLIISSQYYDKIYQRLLAEGKLDNPHLGEIYAQNFYKNPPLYGSNIPIEEYQWQWLHSHFKGEYSQHILDLIRNNRGNPAAPKYKKIKEVLGDAGDEDYWKSVKGRNLHSKAAVLDAGAYIGDTIEPLVQAIGRPIDTYFAFEPMEESFERLAALHPLGIRKFIPINKALGLGEEKAMATFNAETPTSSSLNQYGGTEAQVEIKITSIDSLKLHSMEDTDFYIKMDIEGSELEALRGGEQLIRTRHPNLAVCLYHKAHDLFEIPQYIDSLNLGYEFYLSGGCHTIMIAVPGV